MSLLSKNTVSIKSTADKVWDLMTQPAQIKEWLYGTDTFTDWEEGSPIVFRGEWEGTSYEDKGKILKVNPKVQIIYTYWSSMSGEADVPENYAQITYDVVSENDNVSLSITQDNIKTEDTRKHSDNSWRQILNKIKEMAEKR